MVLGAILPIGIIIGLALVFRKDITNFLSGGLTGLGESLGAGLNQAGEDLDKFGKEQQKAFDDFISQTQKDIDVTLSGINQAGIDAQANVNQFLTDAQKNFDANIAGIDAGVKDVQQQITSGVADVQRDIDQFGKDVQTNIIKSVEGVQKDFEDFFSPIFGGQNGTKTIPTKIPTSMTTGQAGARSRRGLKNNLPTKSVMDSPKTSEVRTIISTGKTRQEILDFRKNQTQIRKALTTQDIEKIASVGSSANPIKGEQPNINLVSKFIKEPEQIIKRSTRFSR